jgi:hypothetical protein
VTSRWRIVRPGLALRRDLIAPASADAIWAWSWSLPVAAPGAVDPAAGFAFSELSYDGEVVPGRVEAAAGDPIWAADGPRRGGPIPPPLEGLRTAACAAVRELEIVGAAAPGVVDFTSVYADRFDPGARFVPHADRDIYGPVVATVSLGCQVTVRFSDGAGERVDLPVPDRAIYVFWPPLRHLPWVHEVLPVTDRRLSISLRTGAGEDTSP